MSTVERFDPFDVPGLIDRYLANEASAEEQACVAAWVAEEPSRADVLARMRWGVKAAARGVREYGAEAALERVLERAHGRRQEFGGRGVSLGKQSLRGDAGFVKKPLPLGKQTLGGHSSSVLLVGMLAIMVLVGLRLWHPKPGEVPRQYVTRAGQRLEVVLRNKIRVILAPQTTLQLTSTTGTLVGEAFFEIPSHTGTPFVVRTGAITTRVLGTAFDVTRYPDQRETRVIVMSGKVATGTKSAATLSARMMARVNDSTIAVMHIDDVTPFTGWTRGTLTFDDAPVAVVLASLGRWYGLTFRLTDSTLATRHLTTMLDTRRDRSQVFEVLESALSVRMTAIGDTVVLTPRQPLPHTAPGRPVGPSIMLPPEMGR